MNAFEAVTPILNAKNVPVSTDYYVNQFGFTKRWDWGNPPTFGCVARDSFQSVTARGARSAHELNVEDPDGQRIRFGSDSTGPADPAKVGRYWDELQFPDR